MQPAAKLGHADGTAEQHAEQLRLLRSQPMLAADLEVAPLHEEGQPQQYGRKLLPPQVVHYPSIGCASSHRELV
jgi:hypothetical protein